MEIKWKVLDEEGHYFRKDKNKLKVTEYLWTRKSEITNGDGVHYYLVFSRPIEWQGKNNKPVELAFFLDDSNNMEKIRSIKKPLFVLFPTTKETHMGFLMNGPYRTPPHRETVSEEDEFNNFLVNETANLLCRSLNEIKKENLLNISLLEALPISIDDFPKESMFRPVYDKVRDALINLPLMLTSDKDYIPGKYSRLARAEDLTKLFNGNQLTELLGCEKPVKWLTADITENKKDLCEYIRGRRSHYSEDKEEIDPFVKDIEIRPRHIIKLLTEEFVKNQSDEWIIKLYGFFSKPNRKDLLNELKHQPIIRTEEERHLSPFDKDDNPNVYIPPKNDTDFPIVKRVIVENEKALEFLTKKEYLGLDKPDIVAEVIEKVLPKYCEGDQKNISKDEHQRDIAKILQAYSKDSSEKKKQRFVQQLENTPFIQAINAASCNVEFKKPSEVYFRSDVLEVFFKNNLDIWFVQDEYSDDNFLELLARLSAKKNPRIDKKKWWPWDGKHTKGFEYNYNRMEGLEAFLKTRESEDESLVLWNLLISLLDNNEIRLRGKLIYSSNKQFPTDRTKEEEKFSDIYGLLAEYRWLPDQSGMFHKPNEISIDDLPESFQRDDKITEQLGMKKDAVAKLAEAAGISQGVINIAKELERKPQLLAECRKRLLTVTPNNGSSEPETGLVQIDYTKKLHQSFNKPGKTEIQEQVLDDGKVRKPERRRNKIGDEYSERFHNEPSADERRKETISTILEGPDEQVRYYLYLLYGGKCQICGQSFSERDGKPFFVANYIVPRKIARAIDTPANALCLCADHFAKWQHGAKEGKDIIEQIRSFKMEAEGGSEKPILKFKICDEECEITFKEKHILELQELMNEKLKRTKKNSINYKVV